MSNTENQNKEIEITFLNSFWMWFKLQREIKSNEATSKTYVHLAEIYSCYFMYRSAFYHALKAVKLDRTNPEAYMALGITKSSFKNDSSGCKKYFIKALELGIKKKYLPIGLLAMIYYQEADFEKFLDYKKQFLDLEENDFNFYFMKAYVDIESYLPKEAFKSIFKGIKYSIQKCRFPLLTIFSILSFMLVIFGTNIFYKNFCKAYYLLNTDEEKGEEFIFEVTQKTQKYKEAFYNLLLDKYYDNGNYKKCIEIANKILIKDKYWKAYEYKKHSYIALNDEEKVIEVINTMQKNNIQTEEEDYNIQLGKIYFEKENFSKALNYFNKQIISSPSSHPFLYKGMCLEGMSDYENAIKAYNTSLDYEKSDLAYYRVANLYYLEKDYHKALESINNGLLLNKDSYNYNLKGDILTAMLRIKEARICYKKAEMLG